MIGVFLLDDHEIVRKGVRDLLEAEADITVVGEAGTGGAALARISAVRPVVAGVGVRAAARGGGGRWPEGPALQTGGRLQDAPSVRRRRGTVALYQGGSRGSCHKTDPWTRLGGRGAQGRVGRSAAGPPAPQQGDGPNAGPPPPVRPAGRADRTGAPHPG